MLKSSVIKICILFIFGTQTIATDLKSLCNSTEAPSVISSHLEWCKEQENLTLRLREPEEISILNCFNEYIQIPQNFWGRQSIKAFIFSCYELYGQKLLEHLGTDKNHGIFNKILIKAALSGFEIEEEQVILKVLGFEYEKNQEPLLIIPYITQDLHPKFFEKDYSSEKATKFWAHTEVQSLKDEFFPRAIFLFLQPYNAVDYEELAKKVMAKIKTLTFFLKKRNQSPFLEDELRIKRVSEFMRALGLSGLNLPCQNDAEILTKGTRIRGQILPKINLGKNKKRKIMLYDHQNFCSIKALPVSACLTSEKTYRVFTGKKRSFSRAFSDSVSSTQQP